MLRAGKKVLLAYAGLPCTLPEAISITDARLRPVWGEWLYRLKLQSSSQAPQRRCIFPSLPLSPLMDMPSTKYLCTKKTMIRNMNRPKLPIREYLHCIGK